MPRSLKPMSMEKGIHKLTGVEWELFLDRNNGEFYCEVLGITIRNAAMNLLRGEVNSFLTASAQIEWKPVIEVKRLNPFGSGYGNPDPFIGFTVHRYQIGKKQNGSFVSCSWDQGFNPIKSESGIDWRMKQHRPLSVLIKHSPIGANGYITQEAAMQPRERYADMWRLPVYSGDHIYLDYTDNLWAGLLALKKMIQELRVKFDGLVNTADGLSYIQMVGAGQLALPEPTINMDNTGE